MSTIGLCLAKKVQEGKLSREQADRALKLIGKLEAEYSTTMSRTAAEAAAAARASEILTAEARAKKRDIVLQAQASSAAMEQALAHPKGTYAGVAAVFARDWWNRAGGTSVEARIKTVRRALFQKFGAGVEAYRSTALGLKRPSLVKLVREIYGESTGDATAATTARAWSETAAYGVERFNAAGGHLTAKRDWRLPQAMEPARLKGRRDQWIEYMREAYVAGRLKVWDYELDRMADAATFEGILSDAFDRIATDGAVDITPGQTGGRKVANQRTDHRVFEWTTADAWLDANQQWGRGDDGIYPMLIGHLERMARDIGMMEKLGPNPDLTARMLIDQARKDEVGGIKTGNLGAIWDQVSGKSNVAVSARLAHTAGGIRAWLAAAQLGSAVLSATTDFHTLRATAKFNALPASQVMARYIKLLAGDADSKTLALRTGIIAEGWIHSSKAALRDALDEQFTGIAGLAAEAVFRASGLSKHTDAARQAFGLEFLAFLADHARTRFGGLPDGLQRGFQRYGIGEAQWHAIGQAVETVKGASFVSPALLDGIDRKTGAQLMDMILTEMDYAIVVPGARERSWMVGGGHELLRRGSIVGEILRTGSQYKSFPVTMMTTHTLRALQTPGVLAKFGAVFSLAISTTVLGGLAVQMKQLVQGKDPRDMTDSKFWGAAFFQGGGAGIVGDFLYSATDRTHRSFYMQMTGGPFGGLVDDVASLAGFNLGSVVRDENTNFGRDLARFVRNYTPGSTLWYSRLAVDRLLWNTLQRMLDRDAAGSFRRMEQRARKEYGQSFWWRPGRNAPDRAPNIGAAIED
ncbi:hypothetical protein [Dongia sp.]|uniref:hypothetical protein n=1 Tax=Dongia sp. TaxID=1977262 RepID=UPI003751E33D